MTTHEILEGAKEIVAPRAQKMTGVSNPFIDLSSLKSLCQENETLSDCLRDFVQYSLRYAETVCRFEMIVLSGGSRAEIDAVRSTVHDATIDAINILLRALKGAKKESKWASKLTDRTAYGKFALLIGFEAVNTKEV